MALGEPGGGEGYFPEVIIAIAFAKETQSQVQPSSVAK